MVKLFKYMGVSSLIIGIIGLLVALYYELVLIQHIKENSAVSELVTWYKYGDPIRPFLMAGSLIGTFIGIISIIKGRIWWSLCGLILCAWNFLELFFSS